MDCKKILAPVHIDLWNYFVKIQIAILLHSFVLFYHLD